MIAIKPNNTPAPFPFPSLIDAYYVDWDLLSYIQDHSFYLAASAAGERHLMDGPFDAEINQAVLEAIARIAVGAVTGGPVGVGLALIAINGIQPMIRAHYRSSYLYRLLVTENPVGTVVQNILGYPKSDLDKGRKP